MRTIQGELERGALLGPSPRYTHELPDGRWGVGVLRDSSWGRGAVAGCEYDSLVMPPSSVPSHIMATHGPRPGDVLTAYPAVEQPGSRLYPDRLDLRRPIVSAVITLAAPASRSSLFTVLGLYPKAVLGREEAVTGQTFGFLPLAGNQYRRVGTLLSNRFDPRILGQYTPEATGAMIDDLRGRCAYEVYNGLQSSPLSVLMTAIAERDARVHAAAGNMSSDSLKGLAAAVTSVAY